MRQVVKSGQDRRNTAANGVAVENASRRSDVRLAFEITLALRVFWSIVAAGLSFVLHPDPALIHRNGLTDHLPAPGGLRYALAGVWERFDTLWYLHIAEKGYDLPITAIFYPLYPMTIRALSWAMPPLAAALLISTVAAFFFFLGLLRLSKSDLAESGRIRLVLLVAAWPTSFILFSGYAEALTLAFVVWAVEFAREERWWPAAACGVLAGWGRPAGVLVVIPLFLLALRSRRPACLPVLLAPAGLLSYWGWLRWSGRLSVVEAYRQYQGATLAPPWAGLGEVIRIVAAQHDWLLAIKLGLVLLMAVLSLARHVRLEDKLFGLAVILQMLMYTGRPLLGAARYLLFVYPAFVAMAAFAEKRWNRRQFAFYFSALSVLNFMWMVAFLNWSLVL